MRSHSDQTCEAACDGRAFRRGGRNAVGASRVPANRVTAILHGQRGITAADTALRLARYFGTTPQLWLNSAADLRAASGGNRGGPSGRRDRPAPGYGGAGGL